MNSKNGSDKSSVGTRGRILVVDDEGPMRRALQINLEARDFEVLLAASGEEALRLAASGHPDAVLLDLGLPGIDGLDVIGGLRGWTEVPILVVSARDSERDKVLALDAGADDFVTKPFGMDELLARLRAALRRATADDLEEPLIVTATFTVDLADKRVIANDYKSSDSSRGAEIHLTPTEFRLLEVLVRSRGRLVSQQRLLSEVWGPNYRDETNYLRVHVGNLRRKLEPLPSQPQYLFTEPGMGYRFVVGDG